MNLSRLIASGTAGLAALSLAACTGLGAIAQPQSSTSTTTTQTSSTASATSATRDLRNGLKHCATATFLQKMYPKWSSTGTRSSDRISEWL